MAQKRACDACYKRKIQCDWEKAEARCDWCAHQDLACTSNRVRGRKKACRTRAAQNAHSSVQSNPQGQKEPATEQPNALLIGNGKPGLQRTLLQPSKSRSPSATDSPSYKSSVSYCQINYNGLNFGHLSHQNGMPLFNEEGRRWISLRTGEEVSFRKFDSCSYRHAMPHNFLTPEHYATAADLYELPDRSLVDTIFDLFIHSALSMVFPLVDRKLFLETMNLAYDSKSDPVSIEAISAKACVLAFVSISCLFFRSRDVNLPALDVERCAINAQLLLSFTAEEASLTTLQAVVMLAVFGTLTGHLQSSLTYHSIACRIIFKLGGHVQLPPKNVVTLVDRERRQARILFWLCYCIDKDTALRTGQPPFISGEYCDLTPLDGYDDWYNHLPKLDDRIPLSGDETTLTPHLPEDPGLSRIKEKVSRRLYSAQTIKKTNAELLRDIRELDEELEEWRLSIPVAFRPALSISDKCRVDVGETCRPKSMAQITLHLGYHHVMTAIHRASGRCLPSQESVDGEDCLAGVRSSMALAIEASRSTLVYLRAAMRGVAGEAFWVIVFYPTTAMMGLFLNILMDPINPEVEQDVALLASTADLIHSMPIHRLTSYELAHKELVTEFVLELSRLSKKAIAKAKAEYRHRGVTDNTIQSA